MCNLFVPHRLILSHIFDTVEYSKGRYYSIWDKSELSSRGVGMLSMATYTSTVGFLTIDYIDRGGVGFQLSHYRQSQHIRQLVNKLKFSLPRILRQCVPNVSLFIHFSVTPDLYPSPIPVKVLSNCCFYVKLVLISCLITTT